MRAIPSFQRALIIVNPRSGRCRTQPQIAADLQRIGEDRVEVRTTADLEDLHAACGQAARHGVDQVACVGGDGTASAVVTALGEAYRGRPLPQLTFLRGGTMNTVAACLGVPEGSPKQLLRRWLRGPVSVRRVAPLSVDGSLGFLFGVGLFPNWMEAYYAAGHGHPTRLTAARMTAHAALSAMLGGPLGERVTRTIDVEVDTDGEPWPAEPFMSFMAGAVEEVGLGFRIFPHAADDPQRVDFIGLRSPGWRLALALPGMLVHRRGLPPRLHKERLAREAVLRSNNGPLLFSLDGDLHRTGSALRVRRGPVFPITQLPRRSLN